MIIIAEVSELTRKIKLPTDRVLSVNGDYQVDGIAFKLPATYEGDFDFSTAAARVHWTGVDKVEHTNLITEVDGNGYPLWVMPSELTQGGHGVIEFAISFVATDATAAVTKRWISDPVSFRNRRTVNGSNEDEEAEEETTYDRLASAIADVRAAQASVDDVAEVLSSLGTLTFHFVDAKADMTDQTKLYVLTTDGYLYYYSTAASDFVPALEVGGSQEVIDARTDENGTTYANLKTRINTGFTQLKEDLSAVSEGLDDETARAQAEEARIEALFTGDVSEAVNDWLDEHPEATTTVRDGSLTEAKFSNALKLSTIKDYVTPEMFGAVGDGKTDDSAAINSMLTSDSKHYFFPSKTYLIEDSIDIAEESCIVFFDGTMFKTTDSNDVRCFEYMVGLKAQNVNIFGTFHIRCNKSVNIGLWLSACGNSHIDCVHVTGARVWGICMDDTSWGNNALVFDKILCSGCGYKVTAKAKYNTTNVFALTEISNKYFNLLTLAAKRACLNNDYNSAECIIDDSGYTSGTSMANRAVFYSKGRGETFTLNDDMTTGVFTQTPGVGWLSPKTDFVDGDDGRAVFIPIGGCVKFASAGSEGVFTIGSLITQSSPVSFYCQQGYGGRIGTYCTEFDSVIMSMPLSPVYKVDIGYMYAEGVGNGMVYDNDNKRIFLIAFNSDTTVNVHSPFHGASRSFFHRHNLVVLNAQNNANNNNTSKAILANPDAVVNAKLNSFNYWANVSTFQATISDYTPKDICALVNGFNSTKTFIINLYDKAMNYFTPFTPVNVYIKRTSDIHDNIVRVILEDGMSDAGYSINGAVDGVLSIDTTEYGEYIKITFLLFKNVFYVVAEALSFVDNTTT